VTQKVTVYLSKTCTHIYRTRHITPLAPAVASNSTLCIVQFSSFGFSEKKTARSYTMRTVTLPYPKGL